jgi:magnesium transporter
MREIADEPRCWYPQRPTGRSGSLFEKYDLTTAGVVDESGKLLGMITVDDVMEVAREEFEEDVYSLVG